MKDSQQIEWRAEPGVVRTILEDSFKGGWDDALAELIKNSIDASALTIDIECPVRPVLVPVDDQVVVVRDDGNGMTMEDLRTKYFRNGRATRSEDGPELPGGTPRLGRRGTGKLAATTVAERVHVVTKRDGSSLSFSYSRTSVHSSCGDGLPKTVVARETETRTRKGTEVRLVGFSPGHAPPGPNDVANTLIRHFSDRSKIVFRVNGEVFRLEDHSEVLLNIEEDVPGVGRVSGKLLTCRRQLNTPGVVVYSEGQRVYGPSLMGRSPADYSGPYKAELSKVVGRLRVQAPKGQRVLVNAWSLTPHFKAFEAWVGGQIEDAVTDRVSSVLSEKVDRWLEDPIAKREFGRATAREKAAAKRVLSRRAKRAGKTRGGGQSERIITRLVIRAIRLGNLGILLDAIDDADDEVIDTMGELLSGDDAWTLRQVTLGAAVVKAKLEALAELEAVTGDTTYSEADVHRILEANPWMIADDFHSFRSNRQIDTTLRKVFQMSEKVERGKKRPDFVFVLGDDASSIGDNGARYLFVELKAPKVALHFKHGDQVTGDARRLQSKRPGFAYCDLLGPELDKDLPATPSRSEGLWELRVMTFPELVRRARFRLMYISQGVESDEGAEIAKRWAETVERDIDKLISK